MENMINTNDTHNKAFEIIKSITQRLAPLITLWVFICLIWSAASTMKAYQIEYANNLSAFKTSCIRGGGKIRHDSKLLGVDIYCQKLSGDEFAFYNESTATYKYFMFTFADRMLFSAFEIRKSLSERESK